MTPHEIDTLLRRELRQIAPEIDVDEIDRHVDLREEFDIDSLDFLNLITALSKRLTIKIPTADYPKLFTYSDMMAYLGVQTQ